MVLILMVLLLAGSGVLLALRRSKESWLVLGLVLSLDVFLLGILTYIAKKGGIGNQIETLFYLTSDVRRFFQYRVMTLGQLGFFVAVGRYTFPPLLVALALHYSLSPRLRPLRKKAWAFFLLPALTLLVYLPPVFKQLTHNRLELQKFLVQASLAWIWVYLLLAAALLIYEYFSVCISFLKKRYLAKALLPLSMGLLFAMYCPQDPAQIYLFYSSDYMWLLGIWYLNPILSPSRYIAVIAITAVAGVMCFYTLLRNTRTYISENQQELVLQRKFDAANMGVSVFVHSMKNQLLANRVLHKRIKAALAEPQPDLEKLRQYSAMLDETNEALLQRMEELYQSVKAKSLYLSVVPADQVAQKATERFRHKYPEGRVQVQAPEGLKILADTVHLAEALYNLLTNGWEAMVMAGCTGPDRAVRLNIYNERLYTVIEVADQGPGISQEEQKRIFEPFYSSKNSNQNWGMGLYYVRQIVKSHLGHLRVESKKGQGTRFLILLPRYAARSAGTDVLLESGEHKEVVLNREGVRK